MSKIKPAFSSNGYDESKDSPPSLEDIVTWDLSREEIEKSQRVSIRRVPEIIKSTSLFLKKKHENLYSLSQVTRYGTKLGAMVLQKAIPSKEIRSHWKKAYINGDAMKRMKLCSTVIYDFGFRLGLPLPQITTCYVFRWTAGLIDDFSQSLGLSASAITILMLLAGFSRSENWIPPEYKDLFTQEIKHFEGWISERFEKL